MRVLFIPKIYLQLFGLAVIVALVTGVLYPALGMSLISRLSRNNEVSLVAVGDVMVGRRVAEAMRILGPGYPFAQTAGILTKGDITFANLESPLGLPNKNYPQYGLFKPNPSAIEGLRQAGIDIVSLANNHACDCGKAALLDTLTNLKQNRILYCGAGANLAEARRPVIITENGLRVAFLSYCDFSFIWSKQHSLFRAGTEPGIAPLEKKYLVEDIPKACKMANVVVVSLHFGQEYTDCPTPSQVEAARLAVDSGADLVLGHHPHCLHGIEKYKSGLIFYSLGNFVFDLKREKTKTSMIVKCTLTPRGVPNYELLPVYISNCQPSLLAGQWKGSVLQRIDELSKCVPPANACPGDHPDRCR
ncbi:CapA family protein [Syntrophothermus lipocalidus]|uniref:Capsule synthesis protein, CapA n=1 Tax=Syntrophothermus lipocalidus (strain DSM 12680 / TGB-C1) TaxID=643648 RepID=D7CJG1_SYNLT|nr:CapA family protein [Syntrophothermus lipocalidus]ADI01050.1 Capsule synthesis protein, CapA [Syntrophothermus lipocalidus DSM 12680]